MSDEGPQASITNVEQAFLDTLAMIVADPPPSTGCYLGSAAIVVLPEDIAPLYNLLVGEDEEGLRRLRYTVAAALRAQIDEGKLTGHFAASDNRLERRHGL
jgi:hypothetical protein